MRSPTAAPGSKGGSPDPAAAVTRRGSDRLAGQRGSAIPVFPTGVRTTQPTAQLASGASTPAPPSRRRRRAIPLRPHASRQPRCCLRPLGCRLSARQSSGPGGGSSSGSELVWTTVSHWTDRDWKFTTDRSLFQCYLSRCVFYSYTLP